MKQLSSFDTLEVRSKNVKYFISVEWKKSLNETFAVNVSTLGSHNSASHPSNLGIQF